MPNNWSYDVLSIADFHLIPTYTISGSCNQSFQTCVYAVPLLGHQVFRFFFLVVINFSMLIPRHYPGNWLQFFLPMWNTGTPITTAVDAVS